MDSAKAAKGCITCRDRGTLCDRKLPGCMKCFRTKRVCKGYGLRLSWPIAGDGRRSIIGKPQPYRQRTRRISDVRLVHTTSQDVEIHYHLTQSPPKEHTRPIIHIPMVAELKGGKYIVRHAASRALTTFGYPPTEVGNTLIRIALGSKSGSALGVLRSLLALSSLHRHGLQPQAVELKISALNALATASGNNVGTMEAIQHVAAGMLLCSFEIHQSSCLSSQWVLYIRGVKKVIKATSLSKLHSDTDLAILLDWVYYHDVLAHFTLRHWRRETAEARTLPSPMRFLKATSSPTSSTFLTIDMLSEVCKTLSSKPQNGKSSNDSGDEYKHTVEVLDTKIRNHEISTSICQSEFQDARSVMELYRLAILVYLNRASGTLFDHANRFQQDIDKAFKLLPRLSSCERQFPIFILGCEARTDDQRAIVLDLISRTEKKVSSRSFNHVKILVQGIWAQDDLSDRKLNYWDKMSYMISCCSVTPTFV